MVSQLPYARIAVPIPLPQLFDYEVPAALDARTRPGSVVRVPMGSRIVTGYCIERTATTEHAKLKAIDAVVSDEPLLDQHLIDFTRWIADYYLASHGEVIDGALPKLARTMRSRRDIRWIRRLVAESAPQVGNGAATRERLLAALPDVGDTQPVKALLDNARASEASVRTLVKQGVVEVFTAPPPRHEAPPEAKAAHPDAPNRLSPSNLTLSEEQAAAVAAIDAAGDSFRTFLLHGVTGSGKTEVYIRAIESCLAVGRGALVLLPEIALTPQTLSRFQCRLGDVAVLHSMLTPTKRWQQYESLRRGGIRVAIGARSAVFAPIAKLGIIVVDECHESSYKQESAPRYHGRDAAVLRAKLLDIPCVLGTATPSLESLHNAASGRYTKLELNERVTEHSLSRVEIVDRRAEPQATQRRMFSDRLLREMESALARDEQVLLFLNRRGFARRVFCSKCHFALGCEACDIGLTYHKRSDRALCHYCGAVYRVPKHCPSCGQPGLQQSRPGTERIEDTLEHYFPNVPVGRLDRDTATSGTRMASILEDFRSGKTQILVGTQMIAKGHDIPNVTLVGVLDADVALDLPDFRAAERSFQLLCQVAGRAGRGTRPGLVIVQTRQPDHYAIRAAQQQDPHAIYTQESATRRALSYPPFGFLVRILCEDHDETRAHQSARSLLDHLLAKSPAVRVLGPAPAPMPRLRERYRVHILLKSPDRSALHACARQLAFNRPRWGTTKVGFDVDPQQLL